NRFVIRRIVGIHPIKVEVPVDIHAVGGFALDEEFQAVTNLAILKLGALGIHLKLVLRLGGEGDDGIDYRAGFAKIAGVVADLLFPWLAVKRKGNQWAGKDLGLFAGKIRGGAFFALHLHFFAGFDLDERFRGRAIFSIRLEPHGAAEDLGIVVNWHVGARAAGGRLTAVNLMRVVQFIAAGANRNFEPPVSPVIAAEEGAVRTGNRGALRVGERVTDEIGGGILRSIHFHGTFELRLQRGDEW